MFRLSIAAICVAALALAGAAAPAELRHSKAPIVVDTAGELKAALVPANAGRRILVRAGTYEVDSALTVPKGATLEGEGVMQGRDLPTGFVAGTATRIVALPSVSGDLFTLMDDASLRRLLLEDVLGRSGNVVGVVSHAPRTSISASIFECEIVNPNRAGGGLEGPTGAGIVALTRNPGREHSPPPHEGAQIELELERSIVRAPDRALFAMNFASRGRVEVELEENVIASTLEAIGGISRPDAVSRATITIKSRANLYAATGPRSLGWQIGGGSNPPFASTAGTSLNGVEVQSKDDLIEGAETGIFAFAGRRGNDVVGPSSSNTVELELRDLTIRTHDAGADLVLFAALAGDAFTPGDGNRLSVDMRDSTGSGTRLNAYGHVDPEGFGIGNRLEFEGSPDDFADDNAGFDPAPPAEFFARDDD
jgi:hypothetical protein